MCLTLHTSSGILNYSTGEFGYRLVLEIDPNIASYYRALAPKYLGLIGQRYAPHITIVRPWKETPTNLNAWNKYQGEEITFVYDPRLHYGKIYYWLNAFSYRLEKIRKELGLHMSLEHPGVNGYEKYFHITIGNCKDQQ